MLLRSKLSREDEMSCILCEGCGNMLDAKEHPEAYDERTDKWWCWSCFPDYDSDEPVGVQRYLSWSQGR